jgi:hypothetical protein
MDHCFKQQAWGSTSGVEGHQVYGYVPFLVLRVQSGGGDACG